MPCPTRTPVPRPRRAWLALALLALALPAAAGEVYQWKDANGVTHYSDSPPANQGNVKGRQIQNRTGTPSVAQAKPTESAECTTARSNLKQLQSNAPIGLDTDKDGKADSAFTPEQRAAQVKLAEASIAAYCKPAVAAAGTPQA
ncbi:DUF4124 domain-containing protein [Lysobacter sp. 5GHs7-4]|uniref:DUF4124 domain-containing protein n=1 Tax=Lysobacter sp. 5GHs7-4 TaxID=2904253 RepID=UPI001E61D9D5|nr:DUF4124 domain-containing protein [Lysobacter sp. 5GHs7-4]UHQ22642.1 DUF4124 domain-containing protein [Lysobacter sp. 5GHs7-4]